MTAGIAGSRLRRGLAVALQLRGYDLASRRLQATCAGAREGRVREGGAGFSVQGGRAEGGTSNVEHHEEHEGNEG